MYEHIVNGKVVETKYISGILLYSKYAIARQWTSSISKTGNIISTIGLALTVSVVGAEIGVPLMAIGGWISLAGDAGTTISYAMQNRWGKAGKQFIETGASYGVSKFTGGMLRWKSYPTQEIPSEPIIEVASEINSRIVSDILVPGLNGELNTPIAY